MVKEPEVIALGNGRFLIRDGARQTVAYAAGQPSARWVFLDGRVYVIDATARHDAECVPSRDDRTPLASPMSATVADIRVVPGQNVREGDVLVMLEAMKMELPIKSPRDGRIKAVLCNQGELVQPGALLVELE